MVQKLAKVASLGAASHGRFPELYTQLMLQIAKLMNTNTTMVSQILNSKILTQLP